MCHETWENAVFLNNFSTLMEICSLEITLASERSSEEKRSGQIWKWEELEQ